MTTSALAKVLVGVRFRQAGKIFYFDAAGHDLLVSEYVVARTERGIELGRVVIAPGDMLSGESGLGSQPILRVATGEDREAHVHWQERGHETLELVRVRAGETGVRMMIVAAEYNLDGTTLTIYYDSEEHVDYRPVVRALAQELSATIQMERVGPRDRAKVTDGYDRCGQRLCCAAWLTSFPAVSIKMAKEQNLALNPAKISGVCGRLYCCLTYEYETYRELRGTLPKVNSRVSTPTGDAKVIGVNPLKQTVTLYLEGDRKRIEVTADQLQYGKLVRPVDVELGEPTFDEEARQEKTALLPLPPLSSPGRPRREGGPSRPPARPGPQAPRARREGTPPRETRPQPPDPAPAAATEGEAKKRRRRRRRRPGGPSGGEGASSS